MYNLTQMQGDVNLYNLIVYGNDASQGMLVGGLMIAIFFIILFRLVTNNEFSKALLATSFISFILSGILALGELVGMIFPLFFLALLAFTGLYVYTTNK